MRYKNMSLLIFLITINLLGFAVDNGPPNRFDKYAVDALSFEQGISHQTVYDLYKDSNGFLWFGTMYGLVHYMGSEIKVYRHDPKDKSTLSNDDVTKIFEDSKGRFWIATFGGGFNLLDIKNDSIKRYTPKVLELEDKWNGIVWDIKEDKNNNIFIATDNYGILKFNSESESVRQYNIVDSDHSSVEKNLYVDLLDNLFVIVNQKYLLRYNKELDTFENFSFPNLGLPEIRTLVQQDKNTYWFSTKENIIKYDLSSNQHEIINIKYPELSQAKFIREIFIDSKKNIWFGGYGNIFVLNEEANQVTHFDSKEEKNQIFSGGVIDILEDNNGVIWAGIYQGGINKISDKQKIFSSIKFKDDQQNDLPGNKINDMLNLSTNKLLLATNNGLSVYDKQNNSFTIKLVGQSISNILKDADDHFWIGTRTGLLKCNSNFDVVKEFKHIPGKNSITAGVVISLIITSKNELWIGTSTGLSKMNLTDGNIFIFKEDPSNPNSIKGNTILSLYEDSKGFIYAGTYNGLNQYDPTTGDFALYNLDADDPTSISNNYVFSYLEDSKGDFWIGTGGGLNKFNKEEETFSALTEKDGLSNSVIYGLVELSNHLFISTAEGLSVMNLNTKAINKFYQSHGLHGNMFGIRAYSTDNNKFVYMGGLNGFTIINTDEYFSQQIEPEVFINTISSIDNTFKTNLSYKNVEEITIPYNSSYVKFEFTSLDFLNPEQVSFKYQLNGLDSTWIESGGKPFAVYPKIAPGEYTFSVRSVNNTGFEGAKTASIRLIVTPPFWQTYWFYAIVILLIAGSVYGAHRYRVKSELRRLKEIEKLREEEEIKLRKKAADDFHDELGHRITKISLYSELLKRTISDQESGSSLYLKKISDISSNLSTGVKDFIWTLDPGKDSLYDVAVRLKDFGDDLFDKSGISFRTSGIESDYQSVLMPMDWRRHIIFIFKEAMNNILKYSNAENVLLGFEINKNEIDINLTDDGTGFEIEKVKSGRGLKNIRMRAASVNGKVDIQSSPHDGTSIHLHSQLP